MAYQAALREALRLLDEHAAKLQRGQLLQDGDFDDVLHRSVTARVGVLLQRMSAELTQECERLGTWGVLGMGTGGLLIRPETNDVLTRDELIGKCIISLFILTLNMLKTLFQCCIYMFVKK